MATDDLVIVQAYIQNWEGAIGCSFAKDGRDVAVRVGGRLVGVLDSVSLQSHITTWIRGSVRARLKNGPWRDVA